MKQIKTNIILTGMPYSGKTTAGKLLASKLNFDFIDLDILIEEKEGMKISEIFKIKGEAYFRELETSILKHMNEKIPFVLSTGGGTVQKNENYDLLKQLGKIFYLEIEPEILYERIKDDKTRPLLQNNNPKKTLFELYKKRKESYEKADYKINAKKTPDEIINDIIKKL